MKLSMEPDARMLWIYDPSHPDYNTQHAESLRDLRSRAIASAPAWMVREAQLNDLRTEYRPPIEQVCPSCGGNSVGRCTRQGCQ